jgi:hypothetical protein
MRIPPGLERGKSPLYEADKFGIDAFKSNLELGAAEESQEFTVTLQKNVLGKAHAIFAPEPNPGKRFQDLSLIIFKSYK